MRPLAHLTVLVAASSALAQEQPKPAAPAPNPTAPAPSPPPQAKFVGVDKMQMPNGLIVLLYRVNYVDANLLAAEISRWLSKGIDAKVEAVGPTYVPAVPSAERAAKTPTVIPVQAILRIQDTEENWPVLEHVLDLVDVPQAQVYVEAKIAETTYDDDLRIGIEAHVVRPLADTFFRSADVKFPNRLDAQNQFTTAFGWDGKYMTFDYLLDLAQLGAKTQITSKPGIYVGQGETAVIRVGDREPIVQQQLQGNLVTATTVLQDTGLRLEVQPLLIGREGVRARISAEVSRVSDFRITATSSDLQVVNPVISTRNADTVLTVPDEQTVIIAGLEQDLTRDESTGIPLLKDIPFLGYLFGSTTKKKQHTELVFFITFKIRRPGEQVLVVPPSESERVGGR